MDAYYVKFKEKIYILFLYLSLQKRWGYDGTNFDSGR